jgi:bla regulator protein blaR1
MPKSRLLWTVGIVAAVLTLTVAATVVLVGQAPVALEAASVKPSQPGSPDYGANDIQIRAGGQINGRSVLVRTLIKLAYRVQDYALADGPKWIENERFDINAKANVDLGGPFLVAQTGPPSTVELMLRSLLVDRFSLVTHKETRALPIYRLVFARPDHRLGPSLQRTAIDCNTASTLEARRPVGPDLRPTCGMNSKPGTIVAGGATLAQLAASLSSHTERLVVDGTSDRTPFDMVLKWTPDPGMPSPQPSFATPVVDPDRPGLFTAVQEQLGLKLEPSRGPVDVLVIDHVEHPTED